jgi:hypothetical protein
MFLVYTLTLALMISQLSTSLAEMEINTKFFVSLATEVTQKKDVVIALFSLNLQMVTNVGYDTDPICVQLKLSLTSSRLNLSSLYSMIHKNFGVMHSEK